MVSRRLVCALPSLPIRRYEPRQKVTRARKSLLQKTLSALTVKSPPFNFLSSAPLHSHCLASTVELVNVLHDQRVRRVLVIHDLLPPTQLCSRRFAVASRVRGEHGHGHDGGPGRSGNLETGAALHAPSLFLDRFVLPPGRERIPATAAGILSQRIALPRWAYSNRASRSLALPGWAMP